MREIPGFHPGTDSPALRIETQLGEYYESRRAVDGSQRSPGQSDHPGSENREFCSRRSWKSISNSVVLPAVLVHIGSGSQGKKGENEESVQRFVYT